MAGTTTTIAVEEEANHSTMARVVNAHAKIGQTVVRRIIPPRLAMDITIRGEIHTNPRRTRGSRHLLVFLASGSVCHRRRLLPMCRVGASMATPTGKTMLKAMGIASMERRHRVRRRVRIRDSSATVGRRVRMAMDTVRGRMAVSEVEGIKGIKAPETTGRRLRAWHMPPCYLARRSCLSYSGGTHRRYADEAVKCK